MLCPAATGEQLRRRETDWGFEEVIVGISLWDPVSGTVRFCMCHCLFHGGLLLPKTPVILLEHGSVPKNVLTLWISRAARTVVDKRWSVKGHRRGLGPCVCTLWVHTIFSIVFPLYTL